MIDPVQPTRSATTTAGNSGSATNNARTRASNGVKLVGATPRSSRGGTSDPTAFTIVVRKTPNRLAICAFGTPSPASRLIT